MSSNNVELLIYRHGRLEGARSAHNVWVDRGREYLAGLVHLTSFGPDTPERNDRIRYVGVGIGGQHTDFGLSSAAPLDTSYPVGADPHGTAGNAYREDYPVDPLITTLERPVRISGGSTAYPGAGSDVWLVDTPNFFVTHISTTELTVHAVIDGAAGDVVYAPFTQMPLSEAGLFTDQAGIDVNTPFNPLVAYVTFGTILLNSSVTLEIIWSVRF